LPLRALVIELPGRRGADRIAIGNVPNFRILRELGCHAIFAVHIDIVADDLAERGCGGTLQQGNEQA
jgi:hypothetical protein